MRAVLSFVPRRRLLTGLAGSVAVLALGACRQGSPGFVNTDVTGAEFGRGFDLTDHHGQPRTLADFRGKAVAFTFIFSRCPLPDFCPRMGNNFAAARELVLTNTSAPTNWQFISISFDPEYDTPAALRSYARFYRHDNADRWLFTAAPLKVLATLAPELGLMFAREEGGSFSHNLRTVVLDTKGRIHRQFDGNQWTADALATAMLEAAVVR